MSQIAIHLRDDSYAPVFFQYPQQTSPQPAFLEFDPSSPELFLKADYSGEIGPALPADVALGKLVRFYIHSFASRDSLLSLADDEDLAAMLTNVRDHYRIVWNGNNYVGQCDLDEDWQQGIIDYLEHRLIAEEVWLASDWLVGENVIEGVVEHGSFAKYAAAELERAQTVILGDMEEAVVRAVEIEVEHYIRRMSMPSAAIKTAATLWVEYNSSLYASVLEDYNRQFEQDVSS